MVMVERRGDGVRTHRHAIKLAVGRAWLCNDVDGACRMLVFVRRRRCLVDRGSWLLGVLEGGVGGIERAAEGLREGAGVFGGDSCFAKRGHGMGIVWK